MQTLSPQYMAAPVSAFGEGAQLIYWFESDGYGLTWDRVAMVVQHKNMSFAGVMCDIAAGGALYGVLGWYIRNVHMGTSLLLEYHVFYSSVNKWMQWYETW